jgi:hypothetical protein
MEATNPAENKEEFLTKFYAAYKDFEAAQKAITEHTVMINTYVEQANARMKELRAEYHKKAEIVDELDAKIKELSGK